MKRLFTVACLAACGLGFSVFAAVEPEGAVDTDLDAKAPVKKSELGSGEFVISAGEGWIPFEYRKTVEPGSALDFSKLSHRHAPAGKFGRVVAKDGHFEFERLPGVPQRFWGANLCSTANFPNHETAVVLAERLSAIGYNTVRIHHHDGGLAGAKSHDAVAGTSLDPENADKLDFLASELFKRGIYIESDIYVSRRMSWRDLGIDMDGHCGGSYSKIQTAKALMTLHPPAFSNWCAFARSWLSHRNPYTGRTWAEEPAWIGMTLVNEGRYSYPPKELRELEPFKAAWRNWISAKRAADPKCYPELGDNIGNYPKIRWEDLNGNAMPQACCDFAADMQREFVSKARRFLRDELGFKAPLSNESNAAQNAAIGLARADAYDFVDVHAYEGGRAKGPYPARASNENPFMLSRNMMINAAFMRVWNKPFVITETNCGPPNPYRGATTLKIASLAAFQDWSGIWRFTYTHGLKHLGEGNTYALNAPARFDVTGDPLMMLSERVGAALFARGDLGPSEAKCAIVLDEKSVHPQGGVALGTTPPWGWDAVWRMGVGETAPNVETPDAVRISLADAMVSDAAPDAPKPGSVRFDPSNGSFRLATPRSFAAFAESGKVAAGRLKVDFGDRQGTVFLTSVDEKPVAKSSRIICLALVDVQRDGAAYSGPDRKIVVRGGDVGRPLVERRRLPVSIALDGAKNCRVHALDISGRRVGEVPCVLDKGVLSFTADTKGPNGKGVLAWEILR